ncbi:hypothetical protein AKJ50_00235 [candidate division MSBL1 archaeon SCGC-AAA382A13]|uniref:Uncharacterized protein n=1 Tax=candidate division MSBL1 archaeon SCGC-AAA382A13 TaxID=1698279 RepID=A0A133VGX9_9EURY|nr:hypothetical protein AKJ50_00235 [candidate division MSBL1 archaeon SCGC-AAA382A13]
MKEIGQVFTTDMVFAFLLVAAFISISSQAYGIASGQIRGHSSRQALERQANDIANALIKTAGRPRNWENNLGELETLGFTKIDESNNPILNYIDFRKVGRLATTIHENNWDPKNKASNKSIIESFGDNNKQQQKS